MEASETPDWLRAHQAAKQEKPKIGNPNWKKGMPSPCPSGRPRGIVDKRMRLNQALLNDAHAILKVVIENALKGDTAAATLALSKVLPSMKAQAERVQFDFDSNAPLADQVAAVLQAIANGEVSADVAKNIIDAISALGAMKQIDDLEARLAALEGKR